MFVFLKFLAEMYFKDQNRMGGKSTGGKGNLEASQVLKLKLRLNRALKLDEKTWVASMLSPCATVI